MKKTISSLLLISALMLTVLCSLSFETKAQITVDSDGDVGLNNSSPAYNLDVIGDVKLKPSSGSNHFLFGYQNAATLIPNSNNVGDIGIIGYNFYQMRARYVYGNNVLLTSDRRKKENIVDIPNSLEIVKQLSGKRFDYNANAFPNTEPEVLTKMLEESKNNLGFIAQDVEKVMPELVEYDEENDDYYVIINRFVPLLVEAIKEQQSIIEDQEKRIDDLENTISSLNKTTQPANSETNTKRKATSPVVDGNQSIASLEQNHPNPFNENTTIRCYLPENTHSAQLFVYNLNGKQIKNIPLNNRGAVKVVINGSELSAGMYIYSLVTDGKEVDTKRMILTDQ